ncbi:MAG: hypothetical protein CMN30_11405 [Sandaracinus sp.]|nr:hypothetical protein [Sandaracinus sp.]|tara:strand:+ start:940 stop:1683 length:744 start_codon:yes stop_codon:yes gene_type:complete
MVPVPRRPTVWSHVRGALLLGVLFLNFCQGFPGPQLDAERIDRPRNKRAVAQWSSILTTLGHPITPDELRDAVLEYTTAFNMKQGEFLAPVAPAFHWTQIRQRWSLFGSSDSTPWWIHIEGRFHDEDQWRLLWRPMDPDADVLQQLFEYRRLRGIWNPGAEDLRPDHPRFVRFAADTLFDRIPELDEVRIRFQRFYVHVPGSEPPNAHVEWRWESRDTRAGATPLDPPPPEAEAPTGSANPEPEVLE